MAVREVSPAMPVQPVQMPVAETKHSCTRGDPSSGTIVHYTTPKQPYAAVRVTPARELQETDGTLWGQGFGACPDLKRRVAAVGTLHGQAEVLPALAGGGVLAVA